LGGDSFQSAAVVPDFSVVIPFRDEAESIPGLLGEVHSALEGRFSFEVICVDDGSRDATPSVLRDHAARFPALRSLRHEIACGQSRALLTGVLAARAPWIVTLDGDGQNDPADVPKLIAARDDPSAPHPLGMITGERRARKDRWVTRVSSRVANAVRSRVLGDETPDTGCGLKLFSRDAFLALPHFDHMHRFLPALIRRNGGRTVSVPVGHRPRVHGRTHYGVWDRLGSGLLDLAGVLWLNRRIRLPVVVSLDSKGAIHGDSLPLAGDRLRRPGDVLVPVSGSVVPEREAGPERDSGGVLVPEPRGGSPAPRVFRTPA
jgi:glycosyltransferase involved in cell wall biosynthesis